MTVGKLCNREVVVVDRDESILDAVRLMREHHVGSLVVVSHDNGERLPLGILTDRDIVIELLAQQVDLAAVSVGDAMSYQLVTVSESEDHIDAIETMRDKSVRRVPVVNEFGGLVGIFALDDAIELIAEQLVNLVHLIGAQQRREHRTRP